MASAKISRHHAHCPKDGVQRTPPSPETEYDRNPDPRDRDGIIWKKDPDSRSARWNP